MKLKMNYAYYKQKYLHIIKASFPLIYTPYYYFYYLIDNKNKELKYAIKNKYLKFILT